jgi:hypothetical protein
MILICSLTLDLASTCEDQREGATRKSNFSIALSFLGCILLLLGIVSAVLSQLTQHFRQYACILDLTSECLWFYAQPQLRIMSVASRLLSHMSRRGSPSGAPPPYFCITANPARISAFKRPLEVMPIIVRRCLPQHHCTICGLTYRILGSEMTTITMLLSDEWQGFDADFPSSSDHAVAKE